MIEKIRVLHLGSSTGLYGAERWILALIKNLDLDRIEVHVAAIKDAPDLEVALCKEAAERGSFSHVFQAFGKVNFSVIGQIRRYIREHRIQVVHTHFYKTDIIGFLATLGTDCKIVSTPHGWSKHMDFKLWCYERLDRAVFPFLDAVAPLSDELYQPLTRIPGLKSKLHLILNGVDLSEIEEISNCSPVLEERKRSGAFVVGYIGQLIPRKGLDTLVRATAALSSLPLELYLIGDGSQRQELERLARELGLAERVHLMGYRGDRLEWLHGFDCFVLPSRLEGIPRCLMEAMGAGVPVIASDIPGCRDLIEDRHTGLLFRVDDPASLADQISLLATRPGLRAFLSEAAKKQVYEHHSAARMAKDYEELYVSMCGC
jgi:glycosyltransferase involved in cell wall biosynthesis